MGWLVLWICMGILGYMIGNPKGEGGKGAILGLLLGPIGLLFVALSGGNRKECPVCKSKMHPDATVCPHCRGSAAEAAVTINTKQQDNIDTRKCPFCAETIKKEAKVCRYCNRDIPEDKAEQARAVSAGEAYLASLKDTDRDRFEKNLRMTESERRKQCFACHGEGSQCGMCETNEANLKKYVDAKNRMS